MGIKMKFDTKGALRFFLLSTAACLSAGAVHADDAAAEGEVVVTGRRPLAESDAAALKVQKASDSLVSVLSADAIGDLPDQNVAFAIGRLPGVGLERDQGQARYVNLRGMPRRWTTISFDGLSVVSAEGRDSRFDNIPSAIASQVTIQKAIVPSMSGDTVAGNVDIRTRRAFDYKGQHVTGKLGLGYVTLGGGEEIDTNLVYSNIYLGGKLGVVLQGSYYRRNMATENWEVDPYLPARAVTPTKRFAREFEYKNYRLIRYNSSVSSRVDYKVDENNTLFGSFIATIFKDDEQRDNFIVRLDQGTAANGINATTAPVGYNSDAYATANDPTFGTVYGARLNGRIDYRDSEEILATTTLGGEHRNLWGNDVSWRVNQTYGANGADAPVGLAFQSGSSFLDRPSVVYDFRNPDHATVNLYKTTGTTGARALGARAYSTEEFLTPLTSAFRLKGGELTIAWTAKVDVDRQTELFGLPTKVEFGALWTDRKKKNTPQQYIGTPAALTAKGFTLPTWQTFATDDPYRGKQALGYTFRYSEQGRTNDLLDQYINAGALTRDVDYAAQNYWQVTETQTAGYLMGTTNFDWGNIVYGARVEKIENTGQAYVNFAASGPANYQLVHTGGDDTLVYPSVHVNWNLRDDLKARLSLTSTASRPDYDDLRPNYTYSDANQTVSGGNPNAKPEKQKGLDAYLEWYPKNGFLMAGFFYKDIEDVLFTQTGAFGSSVLNDSTHDRSTYALSTLRNGGKGHLQGFEVFASQSAEDVVSNLGWYDWLGGFGLKASATFADSEVDVPANGTVPARKVALPGTSDSVYNIQALYEKYGLTVRLAYQFRTAWIQDIGTYTLAGTAVVPADNGDVYWDDDEEIDLSVRYQINKRLEWFFDASNIGNQPAVRYGGTPDKPIEHERFGPRYVSGVRFNF
jgi:TonB-dependent receptor